MKKSILVTGSSGLIGSEVVSFFINKDYEIHGIDNNQREFFVQQVAHVQDKNFIR